MLLNASLLIAAAAPMPTKRCLQRPVENSAYSRETWMIAGIVAKQQRLSFQLYLTQEERMFLVSAGMTMCGGYRSIGHHGQLSNLNSQMNQRMHATIGALRGPFRT